MKATRVTLAHVAAMAKVDRAVVSRVINNDPTLNIRPETRERVLRAVAALGYRPNAAARSLRTARAHMFGLFIPDFANPVYAEIIKGAEAAAASLGYVLVTGSATGAGLKGYMDQLGQGRIDGLLLAGAEEESELTEQLDRAAVPWIMLNRRIPSARRYVILDDERAARLAVEHLVGLGHRRIAHLAGPATADTATRRSAGYSAAMRDAGLPDGPVVQADYTPAGGAAAMAEILAAPEPPTAVFVANVASAIGALEAARAAGFDIPARLSMVAVHDLDLASYLYPPLTTVRMPLEELGRRGVALLGSLKPDETVEEILDGPIQLIPRASTAPPPG
ncbi:LacI family transcriptional regulator [Thermocatellispora tengchongensis]|uniref:LacI family transcriptional regulator n=1 Tax=Thermocatellispora tengchongensis TaxID=1073253 RepID=A0A840PER4_9ACTN|nr:LacI family DNA-binding transcriptional regulator [Thermocatellispora tengchongensis]MBB5138088.1 LacI family transcriptional regulator [Thermocatellispora tengchongensis]